MLRQGGPAASGPGAALRNLSRLTRNVGPGIKVASRALIGVGALDFLSRTTSTRPGQVGCKRLSVGRRAFAATFLVLASGLSACGQIGSSELAGRAADDFLRALATGDASGAWKHLTTKTQEIAYDNDMAAFANDVSSSDWSKLAWQVGQIRDYDISWGVRVQMSGSSVPTFLLERRIAGGQEGASTIILLVQFASRDDYLIAGQGLDERL